MLVVDEGSLSNVPHESAENAVVDLDERLDSEWAAGPKKKAKGGGLWSPVRLL